MQDLVLMFQFPVEMMINHRRAITVLGKRYRFVQRQPLSIESISLVNLEKTIVRVNKDHATVCQALCDPVKPGLSPLRPVLADVRRISQLFTGKGRIRRKPIAVFDLRNGTRLTGSPICDDFLQAIK